MWDLHNKFVVKVVRTKEEAELCVRKLEARHAISKNHKESEFYRIKILEINEEKV